MKKRILFLASLFLIFITTHAVFAADVYAEYQMTGIGDKSVISKMYSKNGDFRTEVNMEMGGRQLSSISLTLKSRPGVTMVFNSMTKTYTETKMNAETSVKNFKITVLGNEKVGKYNCSHVRMTADGKSWDMWYTKDLPSFSFPIGNIEGSGTQKMIDQLKSKGITGMMVKVAFLKPGTNTATMTMELIKYEPKTLDASLFAIPAGYKKSSVSFDADKMKSMTPEQKKEMMMKLMKEQMKQ
jgi:hypothetical protein